MKWMQRLGAAIGMGADADELRDLAQQHRTEGNEQEAAMLEWAAADSERVQADCLREAADDAENHTLWLPRRRP